MELVRDMLRKQIWAWRDSRWAQAIPAPIRRQIRKWRENVRYLLERIRVQPRKWRMRSQVKRRDFTLVSNNCWGGEIYRDLQTPYLTPFVGLFLLPDSYLDLLENFPAVMALPLEFTSPRRIGSGSLYPVGLLGGRIEIHFVHYKDEAEAREKWERRSARMVGDLDRTFFEFSERDGCTRNHLERFERLPFRNKVVFVMEPDPELRHAVAIPPRDPAAPQMDEGPQLYDRCQRYFSVASWLNGTN